MPWHPSIEFDESDKPMPWRSVAMMVIVMVVPAVVAVTFLGRTGVIAFVAAMLWAQAVTCAFGETGSNGVEDAESEEYAGVFGGVLAIGLTLSVWVGSEYFGSHGFWFPLTFVILALPPHGQLFGRTLKRTVGTRIGTGAALCVAWVTDVTWVLVALAAVCLVLGFRMLPRNYTLFTALLTVAVLDVLALVSEVDRLAYERIGTMGSAAALTVVLALADWAVLRVAAPRQPGLGDAAGLTRYPSGRSWSRPAIRQIVCHSASATGCTERREFLTSTIPDRALSALIASSVTGVGRGATASTVTHSHLPLSSVGSGWASAMTRTIPTQALSVWEW